MQGEIIELDQYENVTGPQIRMKNAIAECRDTLERNRYIEKQRSSQVIKIIGEPGELNLIYRDMITEMTQSVLSDLGKQEEMYYGIAIQYINRFLWRITDHLPSDDRTIWDLFHGRPTEYLAAIRIRDASVIIGNELKRNPLIGSKEHSNYAVLNYIQRLVLLDNEKGDTKGILIEWQEVRIGDQCL